METKLDGAAKEHVAKVLGCFPNTAIYTKLSREGVAALATSVFLAGADWQAANAAEIAEHHVKVFAKGTPGWCAATSIATGIRALSAKESTDGK